MAPVRNRDVLRQVRLLRALAPTPVPVPEVLWEDAGRPPDVPPLFVMSFVAGESVEPLFDVVGTDAVDGATMAARMLAAARTMALLHRIDLGSAGLGGEPVVSADEEIDRWCRVLQTVDQELVPGWPDVADGLRSSAPVPLAPALVHGDFRLGNLLAEGDRITAVVDWEIWSVGDPRVDLGWFLLNGDPDTYRRRARHAAALPSLAELASAYTEAVGRDAPWLGWFVALGLVQVGGHVVVDREAQPSAIVARRRCRGHGARAASAAGPGARTCRSIARVVIAWRKRTVLTVSTVVLRW